MKSVTIGTSHSSSLGSGMKMTGSTAYLIYEPNNGMPLASFGYQDVPNVPTYDMHQLVPPPSLN